MNPKVLSIYQNAKIFLSEEEMKELANCIEKDFGKKESKKEAKCSEALKAWTIEAVTENLLATYFNKHKRINNTSSN